MSVTKETVLEALRAVRGPNRTDDIVSLGLVSEIVVAGKDVMFAINVDPAQADHLEPLRQAAERVVSDIPGIGKVMVTLTAEKKANGTGAEAKPQQAPQGAPPVGGGGGGGKRQSGGVPGVKHIVAVASGKGGVGKSTTAVNLALGLKSLGLNVGVLDADVYGPSMPRLLGLTGRPEPVEPGSRTLKPLQAFGLKVMSIGFLVEEDTPMIWRGPMVMSALQQMLREVDWGDVDIMVVDMPPGTGDAQLTLAQQTPLAGAIIVSTPQDLALIDARKGLNMFRRVDVPVLGIIENMSYFVCSKCGERHEIFGHGGAHTEADRLGVAFLGEIPLDPEMRWRSDSGQPIVVSNPDSLHAAIFRDIAAKVWDGIAGETATPRPVPRIVVE
ncbi:MAG: Mrp/NBP35 family ATP-binding protein [Hyphomicrobiales bacterium]